MPATYATTQRNSSSEFSPDPSPSEVVAQLEVDHRCELRKLSDLAFIFLDATNGDQWEAEKLFDDAVELLLEGGILSMWRYRVVLAKIREGL